jgi:3-hydroxybutyrate dehydrogenase
VCEAITRNNLKASLRTSSSPADEQRVEDGAAEVITTFGSLDALVSSAGIQIVAPLVVFEFAKWKRLLSIHLDGAFQTTRAALRQMCKQAGGSVIYMGSAHSKEASVLKAPYVTAKYGLIGLAKSWRGGPNARRARQRDLPGLCAPPGRKQIPEQAKDLSISEQDVIKSVMLKETVDGDFTTVEDVAEAALFSPRSTRKL